MPTIFIDEAGNTGQNLLDAEQPVLALSSLCLTEDEAQSLKDKYFSGVKAIELKYSSIKSRSSQQSNLLKFLEDLRKTPEIVKFSVVNKKFAVLTKIIDVVIEPGVRSAGIDLYERAGNIAYSNMLHMMLQASEEDFLNEILVLFQKMMRSRSLFDYVVFFQTVFNHQYKHPEAEQLLKDAVFGGYNTLGLNVLSVPKNTLNLAVTSALTLMTLWRKEFRNNEELVLIHDQSSQLMKQKTLWDAIVSPDVPSQEVGYDERTYIFPIAIKETKPDQDSKSWAGLQLADLLAGAIVDSSKWILDQSTKNEGWNYEVSQILNSGSFHIHSIWASDKVVPEDLGATGEGTSYDKLNEIITKELYKQKYSI